MKLGLATGPEELKDDARLTVDQSVLSLTQYCRKKQQLDLSTTTHAQPFHSATPAPPPHRSDLKTGHPKLK